MDQSIEQTYKQNQNLKSIVIIGAGPCGILCTRHLKDKKLNIICIENKEDIGGLWRQDQYSELDHPNLQLNSFYQDHGVLQSSLYENLRANLARYLMTYKGFPTKEEYDEFMTYDQFHQYLQDYSKLHDLKQYMLFNTYVSSVRLTKNLSQDEKTQMKINPTKKFLIKIQSSNDYTQNERYIEADSVVVANGHYSDPYIPKIENADKYKQNKLHSHSMRDKVMDTFKGKHLVIIGSNVSAMDLTCILLKIRNQDLHPQRISIVGNAKSIGAWKNSTSYKQEYEENKLVLIPGRIQSFDSERSMILDSGERVDNIDFFMYATGYKYTFPFIEKNNDIDHLIDFCNKDGKKNCFGPLYRRLINIREPELVFPGLMQNTLTIQSTMERQAICVARHLSGEVKIPSQSQMQEEYDKDLADAKALSEDGNFYFRISFFLGLNEITYIKQLQEIAQIPMDEEFNQIVQEIQIPLHKKIYFNGEYPLLKLEKVSEKLPPNFCPKEGLF